MRRPFVVVDRNVRSPRLFPSDHVQHAPPRVCVALPRYPVHPPWFEFVQLNDEKVCLDYCLSVVNPDPQFCVNTTNCDAGVLPTTAGVSRPAAAGLTAVEREWMWQCISSPAAVSNPVEYCAGEASKPPGVDSQSLTTVLAARDSLVGVKGMCVVSVGLSLVSSGTQRGGKDREVCFASRFRSASC